MLILLRTFRRLLVLTLLIATILPAHIIGATGGSPDNFFPTDANTLAIFEFNGNVQDSSGNDRHATLLDVSSSYVSSTYGQGLRLPSVNDQDQGIEWDSYKNLLVPPYTVEVLVYPEDVDNYARLFTHSLNDDNGLYYIGGSLVNYPDDPLSGVSLPANTLHCLAWSAPVSPANKLNLYLDGDLLGQVNRTYDEPPIARFFMDNYVSAPNENILGYVDAMRISNVVRTDEQLATTCEASNSGESLITDNDGISDEIEQAGPNSGDSNGDGTPDKDQALVTSFLNSVSNKYSVLETANCTGNNSVSISSLSDNPKNDENYNYPAGLINFSLTCGAGATATVSLYFYGLSSESLVLRKYNSSSGEYSTIDTAVITTVSIGGHEATKITYDITDGSPLDDDGEANGIIIDPAGPAILANVIQQPTLPQTGSRNIVTIVIGFLIISIVYLIHGRKLDY